MGYFGLDHREVEKLGEVSGEAMRLYIAIASFAYRDKVVCNPPWWRIAERMGKPFVIDENKVYEKTKDPKKKGKKVPVQEQRKNQKKRLQKLARELEKAGLLEQPTHDIQEDGETKSRRTGKGLDRFRLPFKASLIEEKRQGGNSMIPRGEPDDGRGGNSNEVGGEPDDPRGGTPSPPINNKSNNKINKKNNNNKSLEIEEMLERRKKESLDEEFKRFCEDFSLEEDTEEEEETGFLQNPHEETEIFRTFTKQINLSLLHDLDYKRRLLKESFIRFSQHDWETLREKFHHNHYTEEQIEMMREVIQDESSNFPSHYLDDSISSFGKRRR